ncbi:MAG: acyl carrier protein [Proteobacteria bacterium]|nr:acyl carrier protein [Pseudomonadota bacterium]
MATRRVGSRRVGWGVPLYCSAVRIERESSVAETQRDVLAILDEVLSMKGRALAMTADSPLLGALPELDSMAVVTLLTTLEERFGFTIADDEIDGSTFATVGSLTKFVAAKLDA